MQYVQHAFTRHHTNGTGWEREREREQNSYFSASELFANYSWVPDIYSRSNAQPSYSDSISLDHVATVHEDH